MNKIVLGTAQFGMDYGINNIRGKIPQGEANEILNIAAKSGIDILDTAYGYGSSEEILGNFMKSNGNRFKVISKLPQCKSAEIEKIFLSSLNKLNLPKFYGYLVHNYEHYKGEQKIWEELKELKRVGKVEKIGFSLYRSSEIESIFDDKLEIDILQVPFSVFDQRFRKYFPELKKRNVEIYVRSVFLQGLVFKKPAELDNQFDGIRSNIEKLNILSKETGIPIFALCLNFVIKDEFIDKAVVGVDSIQHFNEINGAADYFLKLESIIPKLYALNSSDERAILPCNWKFQRPVGQ